MSLAWAETYPGTLSYYLASAFREVWMQPSGTVGLVGFATSALFLRDALDKAGIEAQFIARGEYKSAANLFTQDRYTDAHREADSRLLDSLRGQVWRAIAESRHVEPAAVDELANNAPLLRDDAVTGQLVDRIGFRYEAYACISELVGAQGISPETGDADSDPDAPPRLYLSRYAKATANKPASQLPPIPGRKSKPTVAVVTLHGPIVSGRGSPQVLPFGNSAAGGDTIAAALREAAAHDSVEAIVLRVDSPGGSVTGSETIWREVNRVREGGTPVVASMGAVAASGGYYASMGADAIVANAGTITGSIGVVTGKLVARELKDRLGVGSDPVRTNDNADAWSVDKPFTDEQRTRRGGGRPLLHGLRRTRRGRPQTHGRGRRLRCPRQGVDRCRRTRAGPRRRARWAAHRDQQGQGARRARRGRRCPHRQLPWLVVLGLPAPQSVLSASRRVTVGGRRIAAGQVDRRGPQPG
jgi:protease IV